jgi:hypothetical protein
MPSGCEKGQILPSVWARTRKKAIRRGGWPFQWLGVRARPGLVYLKEAMALASSS